MTVPVLCVPRRGPLCNALAGPARTEHRRWFCTEMLLAAGIGLGFVDPTRVKPMAAAPRDMFLDRWVDLSCHWESPRALHWR